jgi:chromate reductase
MTAPLNVAVLVGSLRRASYTRKLAHALIKLAPANIDCQIVEIGDLPLYTEDLDASPPAPWGRFRDEIRRADAILFVTPEYNRSVPGGLKNAIDVGSRPDYPSPWNGLPAAVISCSPYKLGGFGSNHHIRQSLVFLNMPVMQQPEAYIGEVAAMFNDDGEVTHGETLAYLTSLMTGFAAWAELVSKGIRKAAG